MRRLLVVLAVLALAAIGWLVFSGSDGLLDDPGRGGPAADGAAETLEAAKAKKAKERVREQVPRAESVSDFLAQWPPIGQDKPQDPNLAAVTGRVLAGVERPVAEAVVETAQGLMVTARARTRGDGSFLVKNVPVGRGASLTARAAEFAPGGVERLLLVPGQTLDVGVLYLGGALDPDATNRVEVRVVKSGGEGVAGAVVTATSTPSGALVALGAWERQPGGTVVRVKTDDKGSAVFEKLPPSFYDFFSEAEGLTFVARQRVTVQRDTKETITLECGPALSISGTVVDEESKPIDGVRVGALNFQQFTMHPVTSTDEKGAFTIGGLPAGSGFWVFAVKEGRGQKDVQNVEAGRKDLVITLPQGSAMALRVLDAASGKPVTEFLVRPFKNQPFAYVYSPGVSVKAEDGVWRQQLDKGQWGAEVSAKGYAMKALSTVPLDAKEPVEVKLEKGAVVVGRVVSKGAGTPVRGARVYVKRGGFPPSPEKDQQTSTDGAGAFLLDNLGAAAIKLTISHVDHTEQTFDAQPAARGADGAPPPSVEFALGAGGRVAGHAFGPGRASIAGQQLTLMKGFDFSGFRQATIGADGAYSFDHVPPDKYTLSLGGPGGRGQRSEVEVRDGETTTVDFGAESGGQKVVARLMRGEAPVPDITVSLDGGGKTVRARSDASGRATFEGVQPGKYVIAPSFLASSASAEVVVKAEEPPAEVVLEMPALGSIQVRIVDDSTGKTLNGAWANFEQTADAAGKAPAEVRAGSGDRPSGEDGIVNFRNLEAGRYSIRVWRDPYGSEVLDDVALGEGETKTGLEVRLAGAGMIAGTVKSSSDRPVEGAAVHVKDLKGRRVFLLAFATSSADGSYTQAQVKPGEYDVVAEKDGFAPSTQRVVVTNGKETRADFKMLTGGWIDVVVKKADGETPVANAAVTLFDSAGRRVEKGLTLQNVFSSSSNHTDASGKITLKGIAAGQYRVDVAVDAATTVSSAADVHEGSGTPVELRSPK
jgi:protocatechuate 3,4-dioxygenase beta subunit